MHTLFRPAALLLERLNYPQKLAFIGLVFFLPFIFSGYLLISEINGNLAFTERELTGIQAIRPLKKLMRAAQEHRGVAQMALSGHQDALQRLETLEILADEEILVLDGFDAQFGATLNSSAQWRQVKSRWRDLLARPDADADDSLALHTNFIECVQDFLRHVADTSGLSLDPALDTHYLVNAVTVRLPQLTENLGQTRALSLRWQARQEAIPRERYRLTRALVDSQRIQTRLLAVLEQASSQTPGLRERLEAPLKDSMNATAAFLSSVEESLLQANGIPPDGRETFRQATRAIDTIYQLCEITLPTLEKTIKARADKLVQKRRALLAVGAVALLLATYLFLGFTGALIRQINGLREGARAVADGKLDTHLVPEGRDEMARIAYFFNEVVDSLRHQMARAANSESALRRSEEKYRAFMDQANDAMLVANPDGKLLDANRSAEKMLGYSKTEILQMYARDLHPPEDMERLREAFQSLNEHGFSHMEHLVRRKDGSLISADVSAARVEFGGETVLIGSFRDISERKRAEEQLRLAATVFDNAAEGIMITDAAGIIVSVNRAFSALTGYTAQEAVGRTPALLKSGRHDQPFYREMWEHALAEGTWQGEIWDRRKDGLLFPAWLTISVVRAEQGAPRYLVGMFSDISPMKESQRHIEYLANFDHLTGLPNRNLFHERLKRAIAHGAMQGEGFALMFIDLDNFKLINDTRRPRHRRHAAAGSRRASGQMHPRRGYRRPAGRGRIRGAAGKWRTGCGGQQRATHRGNAGHPFQTARRRIPHHVQHRHQPLSERRPGRPDADETRRQRHVPGKTTGQERLSVPRRPGRAIVTHAFWAVPPNLTVQAVSAAMIANSRSMFGCLPGWARASPVCSAYSASPSRAASGVIVPHFAARW